MIEQPNFFLGRVGWLGAYTRIALEGGTYHLACVWLASRIWIPRTLRVGKLGSKVSFKWLLGAEPLAPAPPASQGSAHARRPPFLQLSSSVASAVATVG